MDKGLFILNNLKKNNNLIYEIDDYSDGLFEKINIVYDCGTSSGDNIGTDVIEKSFRQGEDIEILFISHFHSDHVNMIKKTDRTLWID